jgi:hypothetical protein
MYSIGSRVERLGSNVPWCTTGLTPGPLRNTIAGADSTSNLTLKKLKQNKFNKIVDKNVNKQAGEYLKYSQHHLLYGKSNTEKCSPV